jgi:hypothetical protein
VVKVFLNPLLDYGMPLLEILAGRNDGWKSLRKEAEKAYNGGLALVFGDERWQDLQCQLAGILPYAYRAKQLAGTLVQQVKRLPDEHPLSASQLPKLYLHQRSIVFTLMNERTRLEYDRQNSVSWTDFVWDSYLEHVDTRELKMNHYLTPPNSWNKRTSPVFSIKDKRTADRAIWWCKGSLGSKAECIRGHRFNRRCILECGLLDDNFHHHQTMNSWEFNARAVQIQDAFDKHKGSPVTNQALFTPIDFAINMGNERAVESMLSALIERLFPPEDPP